MHELTKGEWMLSPTRDHWVESPPRRAEMPMALITRPEALISLSLVVRHKRIGYGPP